MARGAARMRLRSRFRQSHRGRGAALQEGEKKRVRYSRVHQRVEGENRRLNASNSCTRRIGLAPGPSIGLGTGSSAGGTLSTPGPTFARTLVI